MRFSIIVPVYNTESYLQRCVQSVFQQDFSDWELLLIDDGSTDQSGKIADSYAEKDSRVHALHQSNSGQFLARQHGIQQSRGEYLLFLDSDDALEPVCLKTIDQTLCEKNPDILLFNGCVWKNEEMTMQRIGDLGDDPKKIDVIDFRRQLISSDKLNSLCIKAFRASLFKHDATDYSGMRGKKYGEDKVQLLHPLTLARTIFYIPAVLYRYHYRENSIMACQCTRNASDRLAHDMFHYLLQYMETWHLSGSEDKKRLAGYYMRNFSNAYFYMRREGTHAGCSERRRRRHFRDDFNSSIRYRRYFIYLSFKDKMKFLIAWLGL